MAAGPIVAGVEVEELGLVLEVGPSSVAQGSRGLFVRLAPGVEGVDLPAMTLLSGYATGTFGYERQGDKTVGFTATPQTAVFYKGSLMTVEQALAAAPWGEGEEAKLMGHDVLLDTSSNTLIIKPTKAPVARYFCPNTHPEEHSPTHLGQFCNDRAFYPGVDESSYARLSAIENQVVLVWRIEFSDGMLKPSWPVCVVAKDITFENESAMELGVTYGFGYWRN